MNNTPLKILKNILIASAGLFIFAVGCYLTIQANIGVAPWDSFNLGLSKTFGIKYGTASIIVSVAVVLIDVALKEKIGIGMLLDAFIVGKSVDLLNALDLVPKQTKLLPGLGLMAAGIVIMGFSQFLYMKVGLGCGPRDTLFVGIKRKLPKIPVGAINTAILALVTLCGWLLGGPIGIGTLICAFCIGPVMQLDFKIVKFKPETVAHQGIMESLKVFSNFAKHKAR